MVGDGARVSVGVSVNVGEGVGVCVGEGVIVGMRIVVGEEVGLASGSVAGTWTVSSGCTAWQAERKAMEMKPATRIHRWNVLDILWLYARHILFIRPL